MVQADAGLLAEILLEATPAAERSGLLRSLAKQLGEKAYDRHSLQRAQLTVDLLASSSEDQFETTDLDREVRASLLAFTFNYLQKASSGDKLAVRAAIEICERDGDLLDAFLSQCALAVQKAVHHSASDRSDHVLGPPDDSTSAQGNTRLDTVSLDISDALVSLQCIDYAKVNDLRASEELIGALVALVGASSREFSAQCLATVIALLDTRWWSSHTTFAAWSKIKAFINHKQDRHYATVGFQLWAQLVARREEDMADLIKADDTYWLTLRFGLLHGTPEQRKTCLYILQTSVRFDSKQSRIPNLSFSPSTITKFSTVYQACVLQKYLNQIQDSLPDLLNLSRPSSGIGKSWLLALLGAALENGTQDSIRNMIGEWTMMHGLSVMVGALEDVPEFLEYSFLGWASVSTLYSSSLEKSFSAPMFCRHGERLASFFQSLLSHDMSREARHLIVKAMLKFIVTSGNRIFSSARAFLLQSLSTGLRSIRFELDHEELEHILRIAAEAGFPQIVRDLMLLQCGDLLTMAPRSSLASPAVTNVLDRCSTLRDDALPTQPNEFDAAYQHFYSTGGLHATTKADTESTTVDDQASVSIQHIEHCIDVSETKCLRQNGLYHGCVYTKAALDSSTRENATKEQLESVLYALWDELEVQEYAKNVLMLMPAILFHRKILQAASELASLRDMLNKHLMEMHQLSETRIYMYPPLAEALYIAFTQVPEARILPFVQTFARFANAPPQTRTEFALEEAVAPYLQARAPSRSYKTYYGATEAIGHAYLFQCLNHLPQTEHWLNQRRELLDTLLDPWLHQKAPIPMSSKLKTSAQLQTMLLLLEGLLPHISDDERSAYVTSFQQIVSLEPLPRYRYLLEWILCRLYTHAPEASRWQTLQTLSAIDYYSNPKYLASILKVALVLACLPDSTESFALELMTTLIPLSASPKIVIRHEAQWTIPILWSHSQEQGWSSIVSNPAFARLNEHITGLETYKTPPPTRLLEQFDPRQDHNMVTLFCGDYFNIAPPEPSKMSSVELAEVEQKYCKNGERPGLLPLGRLSRDTGKAGRSASETPTTLAIRSAPVDKPSASIPLQTKASQIAAPSLSLLDSSPTQTRHRNPRQVILVASLIANPFNLGGLSRIGEIFGIHSLYIPSLAVLAHKDFTSVSVSSHLWLPIQELPAKSDGKEENMRAFLKSKKAEGWSVVGIEQTDSSVMLGQSGTSWNFLEKVVLVLGSEREGIPPVLLADMDTCVEIPQVGVTRSLNVQTAAAVAVYEYVRQRG